MFAKWIVHRRNISRSEFFHRSVHFIVVHFIVVTEIKIIFVTGLNNQGVTNQMPDTGSLNHSPLMISATQRT
jgi:hypothetical protein